jgi:geranylgeranyl pyrophosphate synthase
VTTFDFSLIHDDLVLVENRLREAANVDFAPLARILGPLLQSGGKRLRPALVLLASRFYDCDLDTTIAVATAVEALHTATLVHDDLIDNSLLRRGSPTLNRTWKSDVVVLVGDYLFGLAAQLASQSRNPDLAELFARTVSVICEGELHNMLDGRRWTITRDEYYRKIYAKTASLFATCCESGALLGGGSERERRLLREYGRTMGMAFQITDDVLDFIGSEETLGKPVGSDLRQGTITLPVICYMESYGDDPIVRKVARGDTTEQTITDLIDHIRASDAISCSFAQAHTLSQEARGYLEEMPSLACRSVLLDLADFVVERKT